MSNSPLLEIRLNSLPALAILFLYFGSCAPPPQHSELPFVTMVDGQMQTDDETFFPVMVNYVVDFVRTPEGPALSPTVEYELPNVYEYSDSKGLEAQFDAHFALLSQKGVNSIRLCFDRLMNTADGLAYRVHEGQPLTVKKHKKEILKALDAVVQTASQNNIRIMLLIRSPESHRDLEAFTKGLLKRYSNEPSIFAYDFFNEPLYFDQERMDKADAYQVVLKWRKWMNSYAPRQLFTIGVAEPIEVSRWDMSIVPVDFVAFHTYHPLRVPNEVYWYSKYIGKPWMIGETNLPADNDSISYEEQKQFLGEAIRQSKLCGAIGFGWWEFQDQPGLVKMEWAYGGLISTEGFTEVPGKDHIIHGTVKPALEYLREALATDFSGRCTCAVNYHNMVGYQNIVLRGTVLDFASGKPVEGATIRGWNEDWSVGMNTFSDRDGNFTLYSNDECVHFEISAPGTELLKFKTYYWYAPLLDNVLPMDLLPKRSLEYQKIFYQPFLKNREVSKQAVADVPFIFDFDPELFSTAVYGGDMGTVLLRPFEPGKVSKRGK